MKDATTKHPKDPLAVLLNKVEWTLEQLALLEVEEQRRRPAKNLSVPEPPPPSAWQAAATPAFPFSHQTYSKKTRVHPIQESLMSMSSHPAAELK